MSDHPGGGRRPRPGRPARLARWAAGAALLAGAPALTACPGDDVDDGTGPDPAPAAREELEAQRQEVRRLTAALAADTAAALSGRVRTATGRWEGCTSVFPEGYRDARYAATARIDAGPAATRPYLDAVAPVLARNGLEAVGAGDRPGGRTLSATLRGPAGELEVTASELPDQGDHVLLAVAGPCVEVPEAEREEWGRRTDPTPIVG